MIHDLATVMRKEWRELLRLRGRIRSTAVWTLLLLALFGLVIPLLTDMSVMSALGGVFLFWVPVILIMPVVADTFAGERERQTLETLLASRLPTAAMVLGKLLVVLLYGYGAMLLLALMSHLVATHGAAAVPAAESLRLLAVSLPAAALLMLLFATGGCLLSLRAPTVRQAQQSIGLVAVVVPFVALLLLVRLPVDWWRALVVALGPGGWARPLAGLVLLGLSLALVLLALRGFRRSVLLQRR